MPIFRASLPLISILFPTAGILIATYLYNRPLSLPKYRKINITYIPSNSFTIFPRSLKIVNPRNHQANVDTRSITLIKSDIGRQGKDQKSLSDEQILASLLQGYFGGWSFTPERNLLAVLRSMGRCLIEAKFSEEIQTTEAAIHTLGEFPADKLPEKGTVLFGGNFLIMDVHIHPSSSSSSLNSLPGSVSTTFNYVDKNDESASISYVDVGFGCNERSFSGVQRFEVRQRPATKDFKDGEVTICLSILNCNPSCDKPPVPKLMFWFHCWYAMCLFRDGIERVISV